MTAHQTGILFFFLIALLPPLTNLLSWWRGTGKKGRPRRRRSLPSGLRMLGWQFILLGLLALGQLDGLWSFDSIGVGWSLPWFACIAIGLLFYAPLVLLSSLIYRALGEPKTRLKSEGLRLWARILPSFRRRWNPASLALCLNPLTEETIYRGILVHQLIQESGSIPLAVGVGLVLWPLGHLYQGVRAIPFHVLFFTCTLALLYSPLGIFGAIGLHLGGDLIPLVLLRRLARRREVRRSMREARSGERAPLSVPT